MKFDELTYTVAEMMGPPQKLTVKADGEVRYESHSNASMPETPEIGVYETKLSSTEIEMLNRSLDNPPFQSLPDHSGRIAAGDRYKRISISSGSSRVEKIAGTTEPVDPGLARLIEQVDQVVAAVMRHAKRTLRMTVSSAAIDDSGTLTIDFELSGGGTEVMDIVNPATLAGSPGLSIRGWPDKSPFDFRSGEVFGVNVDKITEVGNQPEATTSFTRIAPGEVRSFRTTVRLSVPAPQIYLIQLAYQNTTEYPEKPLVIIGELFSKIIRLDVPAK